VKEQPLPLGFLDVPDSKTAKTTPNKVSTHPPMIMTAHLRLSPTVICRWPLSAAM
jgi:hypothetical protein